MQKNALAKPQTSSRAVVDDALGVGDLCTCVRLEHNAKGRQNSAQKAQTRGLQRDRPVCYVGGLCRACEQLLGAVGRFVLRLGCCCTAQTMVKRAHTSPGGG